MDPRRLLLTLRLDLVSAVRRVVGGGRVRLAATVVGGVGLVAMEVWVTTRLTTRLALLPPAVAPLAESVIVRLIELVLQLATAVAVVSSTSSALVVIEGLESDSFEAATPRPSCERAVVGWWRTMAGLGWLVVLAGPPLAVLGAANVGGGRSLVALLFLLAGGAAGGMTLAVVLAGLVPRRILLPAAWTSATAGIVLAVLWLRSLHPERLATASDAASMLRLLAALGGTDAGSGGWAPSPLGIDRIALAVVAAVGASWVVWGSLGGRAGERLARGGDATRGSSRLWRTLDPILTLHPAGALLAARLRLLARDTLQSSQLLYLIGLGVVYVQNLKSLPLDDPLALQLAALFNLGMAGLLAAALALRFAYPSRLLGGSSWWWSTAPLSRCQVDLALTTSASLPILLLAAGLYLSAATATGQPGGHLWLVAWLAIWLSGAGVLAGPEPSQEGHRWIDAALGGGGIAFLALAMISVLWCTAAAFASTLAEVLRGFGLPWTAPILLRTPEIPVFILSAALLIAAGWRWTRMVTAASCARRGG